MLRFLPPDERPALPAPASHHRVLPRSFYQRHPTQVAPQLLNKLLVRSDGRIGRIVEVEAYAGAEDPAAHSWRGRTARNATMFGPAGHLYVYLSHGLHWGANAVCGDVGEGNGVLLRAIAPLAGRPLMRSASPQTTADADIGRGPGRLSRAMGIDRRHDGADLVREDLGLGIHDDGTPPPDEPGCGPRIGISRAVEFPWRWYVSGHHSVSGPRRHAGMLPGG